MIKDLQRAVTAAKDRLDRACSALTLAEHHYESLQVHHQKGKSWTTHSDDELKADFNARYQLVKKALVEKALAEGQYHDLERELNAERQRKRELAAEAAKQAALAAETTRKAEREKTQSKEPEKELEATPELKP